MRAPALAAAWLVALVPVPAGAAESPRTSSLSWVRLPGAESCIGARDVEIAVEQRLGRKVFVAPARATVFIEGRVEPKANEPGFQGHLTIADDHHAVLGSRDLETGATGCRALDEQLALVIALLIDPEGALTKPATPPLPPIVPHVEAPVLVTPPPARERWRGSFDVGPAIAVGLLPGAAVGLTFRAEITPPSFLPIELGGTFWLDDRADLGGKGSVLSLAYGQLGICPFVFGSRTRLTGCAAIDVGVIGAEGYGFYVSRSDARPVVMAAVDSRLAQRIAGPLELGLSIGFSVPFERARFFYLDARGAEQELHRMAPIVGVLAGTLGVAFP